MKFIHLFFMCIATLLLAACGGGSSGGDNNNDDGGGPNGAIVVTAIAGTNGSVSPTQVTLTEGETTQIAITPDNGFEIASVDGCGGTLNDLVFTTDPIISSCTLTVDFSAIGNTVLSNIDYVKAGNTGEGDSFGSDISLNADGTFMVVGARGEASLNGDPEDNSVGLTGAAYVFTRDGTDWSQQAYVKPVSPPADAAKLQFGFSVDINDIGNRIAIATSASTDGNLPFGEVYIFDFVDQAWEITDVISEANSEGFAAAVLGGPEVLAMDGSGNTIIVADSSDSSGTNMVNGDDLNSSAPESGAAYVYFFDPVDAWTRQAYIKGSGVLAEQQFGTAVAISGDGNTIAVSASESTVVNPGSGSVYIFTRENGNWSEQQRIQPANQSTRFGFSVALNQDGSVVAIGQTGDNNPASGINTDPTACCAIGTGAVYIFQRDNSTSNWAQQAYLKASNVQISSGALFGRTVTLNGAGDRLVVGAVGEDSGSSGINGNQNNSDVFNSGAAYVFTRAGDQWMQEAYLKSTNPDQSDNFGHSLSISRNGSVIAIASDREASSATTINGDDSDNSLVGAGAVYLYR